MSTSYINRIQYLNTDLDLESRGDLTALARAFEAAGLLKLHAEAEDSGSSWARFECGDMADEPELHIAAMLSVIEKLWPTERAAWDGCMRREFNIGYDCGTEPPVFSNRLSTPLIEGIAAAGASVVITLYPPDAATGSLARE